MGPQKFTAANAAEALKLVRQKMGPEAMILSTNDVGEGVEVVAITSEDLSTMSANSENLAGWVAGPDAIAFATALPETDIPGWEVANAVDAETGLGVQVIMGQEQSGFMNVTCTLLAGAAVGRASSLVRLKTA